jgi:transposase-like protein
MKRPDLATLACVNAECHLFRHAGGGNLVIRKVYGRDHIRLLRCRRCGEEFSERRGTALFNTKLPEEKAESVINHLDEGGGVRSTARLVKVSKDAVARLLRMAGRHAERFHDQQVHDLSPRAVEFDEQWSFVKKSRNAVRPMSRRKQAICGTIPLSRPIANWWCLWWWANGPRSRPVLWSTIRRAVYVQGICPPFLPMRMTATRRPSWRPLAGGTPTQGKVAEGVTRGPWCAGPKGWPMAK